MDRQTLRDWVIRFIAEGPRASAIGPRAVAGPGSTMVSWPLESSGAARSRPRARRRRAWRAKDLCRIVEERFGVAYSENGMLRLLHDLDLSWQKARPIHPEADLKA
jgi:hypothetical protein